MANFIKLKKLGSKLILANGRSISIIKHSRAPSGARHKGRDKTRDITIPTKGSFVGFESSLVDGKTIKDGDKLLLVSPEGFSDDLSNFDEVKDGTKTWKIVDVKTIEPADIVVLYKIHIRR